MAQIYNHNYTSKIRYLLYSLLFIAVVIMFLPWTQSVSANGKLSTLNPSERPQTIPSRISGRIEKWFVKEGDFVKKETLLLLYQRSKKIILTLNSLNAPSRSCAPKNHPFAPMAARLIPLICK